MTLKTNKSSVLNSKNIRLVIKPRESKSNILSPHLKISPISLSSRSSLSSSSSSSSTSLSSTSLSSSSSTSASTSASRTFRTSKTLTSEETIESLGSTPSSNYSKSSTIDDYNSNQNYLKTKLNLYHQCNPLLRGGGGGGGAGAGISSNCSSVTIKNFVTFVNDYLNENENENDESQRNDRNDENENENENKNENDTETENDNINIDNSTKIIVNDVDNRNNDNNYCANVENFVNDKKNCNNNDDNNEIYNSNNNKLEKNDSSLLIKNQLLHKKLSSSSLLVLKTNKSISKIGKETSGKKFKKIVVSICVTYCRYPIIGKIAKSLGWKLVKEDGLWNIMWTDSIQVIETFKDIKRFQRINHFPGMSEICRKDLLARNLNRMLKLFPNDFDIFPKTWCFPADLGDAIAYAKEHKTKTFILKPDQGAQGKGIWLTKNLREVKPNERMICQVYINRPLLMDGYKFDLRLYVLVTSVDPLRIFVYKEGLVRFATNKYKQPTGQNTSNVYMHLTNYSVNKHSRTFCKNNESGSKRKLSAFNHILLSEGYDINILWKHIDDIIIKTILSALPILKHNYRACFPAHNIVQGCFEILGFDILIDSKMKPYLLEVNHSPSFHTDEEVDKDVKESLLKDTFRILNNSQIDKRKIINEDRKRIQNRLINKTKNLSSSVHNENQNEQNGEICSSDPLTQQIKWEETHLGGFRCIMPPNDNDPDKYERFNIVLNQSSIYSETAASKRREEAAKQLRRELLERENRLKQTTIVTNTASGGGAGTTTTDNNNNNTGITMNGSNNSNSNEKSKKSKKLMKKRRYKKILYNQKWLGNYIVDSDERQRVFMLMQRDSFLRDNGIVEFVSIKEKYLFIIVECDCIV